jgi:transcriptional regulator with XRE-family HTH domain
MTTLSTRDLAFLDKSAKFVRMSDAELAAVIGSNVRAARKAAGLSQDALAEKTGIGAPNLSRLEKGTHLPSVATLKRVSDALEVPVCRLLDPPPPDTPAAPGKGKPKRKGKP